MPSPFPGMDPYLESPDWFRDLHGSLIVFMKGALQQSLPEAYYAQSSQRVWLEYSRRCVEPDVEVVHPTPKPRKRSRGGTAVAVFREAGPLVVSVEPIEHGPFKESFLEIRRRRGRDIQIVTSIEILSPSNKKVGSPGHEKFLQKQRETLDSETHLVEIDLLRSGKHTLAVPRDLVEAKAGPFDYLVSIHRFDRPKDFFVYPIALPDRLPDIAIPLLPGDPDVSLDLQAVFDRSYDLGPYRREIEYGRDPVVPRLSAEQAQWARRCSSHGEGTLDDARRLRNRIRLHLADDFVALPGSSSPIAATLGR
jgi:Protein of unknown function (DUF4058)